MSDDFENLVLQSNASHQTKTPAFLMDDEDDPRQSHNQGDEVPAFLAQGNSAANAAAGKRPAFLEDEPSPVAANTKNVNTTAAATDAAVVSSAEKLKLTGEAGDAWNLKREKILGKGSFGCATLYKQRHYADTLKLIALENKSKTSRMREWVVVKDLNVQTMNNKEEELANIQTEVTVLKKCVGHPNCTQFIDYINDSEKSKMIYIFLEYCDGVDLSRMIETAANEKNSSSSASSGYLPEAFVASVLIQVSVALYHIHNHLGVLHRDIKPENVFFLRDQKTVRVGDFGVAAILDRIGGSAKMACGSPFYMAPELLQEKKYNYAVDVWSLGVLLYEAVMLEKPFSSTNLPQLTQLVCQGRCASLLCEGDGSNNNNNNGVVPAAVAQRYSKPLRELIMSMLVVDAAVRPTTRRIVRNPYLKQFLSEVPSAVLDTDAYREIFGEEEVRRALQAQGVTEGDKPKAHREKAPQPAAAAAEEEEYEDDFED